jgi:GAF domain-containing protein
MVLSGLLLVVFISNIIAGAFWSYPFLSDIVEMLLLLAAVIAFAIRLIKMENNNVGNSL